MNYERRCGGRCCGEAGVKVHGDQPLDPRIRRQAAGQQPGGLRRIRGPVIIAGACDNGDNHFVQGGALQRTAPPSLAGTGPRQGRHGNDPRRAPRQGNQGNRGTRALFQASMGRGLCRTAHGELKNIIAFERHQETHRPSPRRPGTRLRHQRQGDNGRNLAHSRDSPTPTATGRSLRLHRGHRRQTLHSRQLNRYSQQPLPMGAARAVESSAIVRHNVESHAQDVEEPHTGIAGCNEQALINATAIEYHDNAAADTEHRFPPRGRGLPRSCQPRDHRENDGDDEPGDMCNTAAPRPWTIITARETTVETGPTPATTPGPPPLVARLQL